MNLRNSPRAQGGFTLVELIVAMLIASILVAIAVPGYNSYVRKSRRTDAKTAVLDLASLEERYYSTQNTYTSTAASLGYSAFPATLGSGTGTYQITVSNVAAPTATATGTYTITATAINDQLKDTQCRTFSVNQLGVQSAADSTGTTNTATCWQ